MYLGMFDLRRHRWGGTSAGILLASALLAVTLAATPVAAQNGRITGVVRDAATMRPMPSVQVYLENSGLGALTNQGGRFLMLNVPPGDYTITAERIGYEASREAVTVTAGGSAEVDFALREVALGLDEIVVTGTAGAARRREVGNSVSQINLTSLDEPVVSTDALLQGRVAGMTVLQSSASAGGGAMIRLRGNNSVAMSNQPIIYVDGIRLRSDAYEKNVPPVGYDGRSNNDVASPLNDINPEDIERIEVIKGAAATTLYGTEASAGVIQIFTKRGHQGQARWTATVEQGFSRVLPFGPDPSERPPSEPAETAAGGTSDFLFINPWLRNAWQQKYSLSVAGGGEALQYFVSGTWENDEGVLPNDREEKGVIRGNFTFTPLEDLQFQWNTSFTSDNIENTAAGNNAHGLTLNAYRRDRNYLGDESFEAIDPFTNQDLTTQIDHFITGLTATYSPTANLTNRVTVGYDLSQINLRNLRPFNFIRAPDGIISDQRVEYETITADYVGSYDFTLTDDVRSSFSWGGQAITQEEQSTTAYGQDFPGPGEPTVSNAGTTLGFEDRVRTVNAGFFFQNILDVLDKYFITAGLRIDGNSAFGENFGLQAYPKVSLSYVVSDEDFWDPGWGQLKLRGAWGQSGRAPGAFDKVRTYQAAGWGGVPAFLPDNVGNPDIGPERTSEIEVGFDGSFVDDRVSMEFTYYNSVTDDALFEVRQVPSLGFLQTQLRNAGELKNQGIELTVNTTPIRNDDFVWDVGFSVFTNDSEVTNLPDEVPSFSLGDFGWVVEGEPVPVIQADCVDNPDERADPDIRRDCTIGPNLPTHTYGINTVLELPAEIRLSARGEYQGGHYMYDGAAWNAVRRSVRWPGCFEAYTVEETQGYENLTAKQRSMCDVQFAQADFFVYPADFFKIREVTASAPLPEGWVPGTSRATLTLSGRNVWKWVNDDFPVFEPEMGANEGFDTTVRALLEHVPPPATYTIALRVTF